MKLVVVEEYQAPEIIDVCGSDFIIVDHKLWNNLEVGDMMQVLGWEFGTTCYIVVGVQAQEPNGAQFVRIAEATAA